MKASFTFREEHQKKPLFRAKLPLKILGFPFQYGVSAGDSKHEFALNLSTLFRFAPSLKFSYRPNDSRNHLSLILKSGTGPFGSPISAPVTISAEFNLLDRGKPKFFLKFRPEFGDFSMKKSFRYPTSGDDSETEGSIGDGETFGHGREVVGFKNGAGSTIGGVLSGVELCARTLVPVRHRNVLKFRWSVRFPTEFERVIMEDVMKDRTANVSFRKFPFLVMSKISIEHTAGERELESQGKAVEELRPEIFVGKSDKVVGSWVSD